VGRQDHIVSDRLNHASIIDGARLSRAKVNVYEHSDMDSLREKLEEAQAGARESGGRVLIITDGVFSMDGDIARLPEVVEIAEEHGAIMMVDDAHASGVLGANGRGTVDHFGLHGRVDVQVGTLSKAIGVLGGYVAGNQALIDFLIHRARPFLFSTSHPPAVTAACIAALDILLAEPEIIDRLWENTRFFKDGLTSLGFDTGASETPITPVIAGDEAAAMKLSDRLFEAGIFVQGIAFPTGHRLLILLVSGARLRALPDEAADSTAMRPLSARSYQVTADPSGARR
jgi:glycine C-acetyltransferase